jgi:hypothetical protein
VNPDQATHKINAYPYPYPDPCDPACDIAVDFVVLATLLAFAWLVLFIRLCCFPYLLLAIAVDRIQLTRMPSQLVLLKLLFLTAFVSFVFYVFFEFRGGWSANKFRKSANLRTYKIWYICWPSASVAICGFAKSSNS